MPHLRQLLGDDAVDRGTNDGIGQCGFAVDFRFHRLLHGGARLIRRGLRRQHIFITHDIHIQRGIGGIQRRLRLIDAGARDADVILRRFHLVAPGDGGIQRGLRLAHGGIGGILILLPRALPYQVQLFFRRIVSRFGDIHFRFSGIDDRLCNRALLQ